MPIRFEQQLTEPAYSGPLGCRRCRGAVNADGSHARPARPAHRPEPAWETIGFTVRGRAVFATVPHWQEVQVWYDDESGDEWFEMPSRPERR